MVDLESIRNSASRRVKVAASDIDGILRGKYVSKEKFLSAAKDRFGFCNVVFGWDCADACYSNSKYTGWHSGYPDAMARIDLATHRTIPWEANTPFFLADFETEEGDPLSICPRQLLKKIIARLEKAGFSARAAMEFEWFNFRETPDSLAKKDYHDPEPLTPGMFGYSLLRAGANNDFFTALMEELRDFGVPLEGLHTETGPGVYEAAITVSSALEAADRAVIFKTAVKEIGARFGIMPSFMAKWNSKLPGCSGHAHLSLWNADGTRNLFHDESAPAHMSALHRSFLAGLMQLLPEVLPFFAPTVNSYKRLVEGFWAPTRVTWGVDNRTVAFRVIPGSWKSTRLEARVPGSDVNAYLALAACFACGLYGIENNFKLREEPVVGSAYASNGIRLPGTLEEASRRLSESPVARDLFGAEFVDHFVRTRLWECEQYRGAVTDWELRRYFEII